MLLREAPQDAARGVYGMRNGEAFTLDCGKQAPGWVYLTNRAGGGWLPEATAKQILRPGGAVHP